MALAEAIMSGAFGAGLPRRGLVTVVPKFTNPEIANIANRNAPNPMMSARTLGFKDRRHASRHV